MNKGDRQFLIFCGGLVFLIVAASVAFIFNPDIAWVIGNLGAVIWVGLTMLYVVFIDSKSRWPGASAFTRFSNVITFKR